MAMTRTLRLGSTGDDVLLLKGRLLELGCYDPLILLIKTNVFGKDTQNAVKTFQARNALVADGIVGKLTYAALFPAQNPTQTREDIPANISEAAAVPIGECILGASQTRRKIVLDALQFAFDPALRRDYPLSLYIRGGNLYNADLSPNVITISRIRSGAKRQPEYYDGGRQQMMERAVEQNPLITGADCSGGVVGLLRHAGVVKSNYDLSADGFAANRGNRHVGKGELLPADLLHKSGHVGLYAGGGYAVEWMGGAYGCQLTHIDQRRGWNFVKDRLDRFGAWENFLRPSWY